MTDFGTTFRWGFRAGRWMLLALVFALGTAVPVRASDEIAVGEVPELRADEGYLLIQVQTDWPIRDLRLKRGFLRGTKMKKVAEGTSTHLLKVKVGEYRVSKVVLDVASGAWPRFRFDDSDLVRLNVEHGKIGYAGTLTLTSRSAGFSMELFARFDLDSAEAYDWMEKNHPRILGKSPIVNLRDPKDPFFSFYSDEIRNAKQVKP